MKITKVSSYTILILKELSEHDKKKAYGAWNMAQKLSLPFDTTAKIMRQLAVAKIIKSALGKTGGYFLVKDIKSISFLDVINATAINPWKLPEIEHNEPIKSLPDHLKASFSKIMLCDLYNSAS